MMEEKVQNDGKSRDENYKRNRNVDGGYAWVVLAATFISFFICGGFLLTSGIIHTALLAKFKQSVAKTSWAGSIFTASLSLTAPIGSAIADRFNCRVAVMVGSGLVALGFLLTGIAPNIEFCIFSYGLITGTGGGISFAILFVVNGFNFKDRLNLAQGIALSGTGCGLFVLAPLFELCKTVFGYTGLFFILAGIAMQLAICGALMRPSAIETRIKLLRHSNQDKPTSSHQKTNLADRYRTAICNRYIMLLSMSMFFFCGGIYSVFLHWPNFCIHQGLSAMQSSYALSVVGFVSIGGRFCSGIIASLRYVSERMVYSGSMIVFGTALVLFFLYSKTFVGHLTLAVIVGLTNGSAYVVITTLTARGVGVHFLASALGMQFMFGGVGSIVIPVLSGYLIHGGISYELVFVLCGLCLLLSAGLGFGTKFVETPVFDALERVVEAGHSDRRIVPGEEVLVVTEGTKMDVVQSSNMLDNESETSQPLIT